MKLVIDRNVWLRGEGSTKSFLLRSSDEKMCCVGIFLKSLGVPEAQLCDTVVADNCSNSLIPDWTKPIAPWGDGGLPPDISELYVTNDYAGGSEAKREQRIADLFAKHDVQVEFIN